MAWNAIPLIFAGLALAIIVPVTCVAWKIFAGLEASSPIVTLPPKALWVVLTLPPSQTLTVIPCPFKFNPREPPVFKWLVLVDFAASTLLVE